MNLVLDRAAQALPADVIQALDQHRGELVAAMSAEVRRALPTLTRDMDLDADFVQVLQIVFPALRERRLVNPDEVRRLWEGWSRVFADRGWTIDDVITFNRVATVAGWEASIPILADLPGFDRAALAELVGPIMRATEAFGPYLAGVYAAATERLANERRALRRRFAEAAFSGTSSEAELRRQARELGIAIADGYRVCAIRGASTAVEIVAISQWESRAGDGAFLGEREGGLVLAVPYGESTPAGRAAQIARDGLSAAGPQSVAGLSETADGLAGLPRAVTEALSTAQLLQRLGAFGEVGAFDDYLVEHLLLGDTGLLQRLVSGVLDDVLRARSGEALVRTLEAYLAADGNVARTAAALGIHRHTAEYRLQKLRDLLGPRRQLISPEVQMAAAGNRLLRALAQASHARDDRPAAARGTGRTVS